MSGAAVLAAAAAFKAVGAIGQGEAQGTAYNNQADLEFQRAGAIRSQGVQNEAAQRRSADMQIGRQVAGAADSGGLSGTNLDLVQQSATNAELDALNIRYGAKVNAQSADQQGQMLRAKAKDARRAGYVNAAASALTSYGAYAMGSAPNPGAGTVSPKK